MAEHAEVLVIEISSEEELEQDSNGDPPMEIIHIQDSSSEEDETEIDILELSTEESMEQDRADEITINQRGRQPERVSSSREDSEEPEVLTIASEMEQERESDLTTARQTEQSVSLLDEDSEGAEVLDILNPEEDEIIATKSHENVVSSKQSHLMEEEENSKNEVVEARDQVMTIGSIDELVQQAGDMPQLPIIRLTSQSALDGSFIGGKIIAHTQDSFSQGGDLSVVIKDVSCPQHLTVYIRGDLAHKIPPLVSRPDIYFYNASVESMESDEFSQDFNKYLVVEGDSALVWVVTTSGKGPRAPGKKWWKKHKKRIAAMNQASSTIQGGPSGTDGGPAILADGGPPSATLEDDTSNDPVEENVPAAEQQPSTSTHSYHFRTRKQSHDTTFPDNFDIPDSAFDTYSTPHANADSSSDDAALSPESSSSGESEIPPKKKKLGITGRKYDYKKISELRPGDKKVNVYGVVQDFSSATTTRGADYCSTLVIVDESCPQDGIKGIFFNRHQYKLPQVKQTGDIICLHRVNVEAHLDTVRIDGSPYSSSMCFDGRLTASLKPRTGAISYTFTDEEKKRVQQLKEWANRQQPKSGRVFTKLEQVTPEVHFNLLCQVVSTSQCSLPRCSVITVWDGTQLPLRPRAIDESLLRPLADPLLPQSRSSGRRRVNVIICDKECWPAVNALKSGDFVLLQNVHAATRYSVNRYGKRVPIAELCMAAVNGDPLKNMIQAIRDDSVMVAELSRTLNSFVEPRPVFYPPVSLVTTTENSPSAPVTLRAVKKNSKSHGESFLCRAKVMSIISPVENLVKLFCPQCLSVFILSPQQRIDAAGVSLRPCGKCSAKGVETVEKPLCCYAIEMEIEDETATLKVYCRGDDAVKLLNNLLPRNLYRDKHSRHILLDKLSLLTGGHDPFDKDGDFHQHPWIDFCISPQPAPLDSKTTTTFFLIVNTVINPGIQHT